MTRPGQHGINRRKATQFAVRLAEKQKLRFYYGVSEKQLVRYVKRARRKKGSTGQILLQQLEMRLDNIVYRLGWAPTLPIARQLVNHGHILVNDKYVTIASFSCMPLQVLKIRNSSSTHRLVKRSRRTRDKKIPSNLLLNVDNIQAVINHLSTRQDVLLELNELLVIEYYSNRLSIPLPMNQVACFVKEHTNIIDFSKRKRCFITFCTMSAAFLSSILVPLVGLIFPRITIRAIFIYVEQDSIN
jgi:small subunit ribosomal protein S4